MADELRDIEDLEPTAEDAANVQGGLKSRLTESEQTFTEKTTETQEGPTKKTP